MATIARILDRMSKRDPRTLSADKQTPVAHRTTRSKAIMETAQLKERLAKLETELEQARSVASETQAQLEEQRQRAGELERELENCNLRCQLEKHDALDALREEHKRALERE